MNGWIRAGKRFLESVGLTTLAGSLCRRAACTTLAGFVVQAARLLFRL